jgi:signal transduction histidine kinase
MSAPAPSAEALSKLISDAYYIVDADDRIVSANEAFHRMFPGLIPRDLREMRCRDTAFLPCRDRCLRERCEAQGVVRLSEIQTWSRDASGAPAMLQLNVIAGPVRLSDGEPGAIIILQDDRNARVEALYQAAVQDELAQAQRRQAVATERRRQRREAVAQMVAGVAHEVNTPLGVANAAAASMVNRLGFGELEKLAKGPAVPEDYQDVQLGVELMQRNLLRVDELVRKFRRLSAGQMVDVREELDLGLSTREALQTWSREAKKANLAIEVVDRLTPGLLWEGYAGHLSQVLHELLSNVKRHAYPDGQGGKVVVTVSSTVVAPPEYQLSVRDFGRPNWRMSKQPGAVPSFSISVRDFGKGVSPDILARAADDLYSRNTKVVSGMGLLAVRGIVEAIFGGALKCESHPSGGASFVATFSHCPPAHEW